MKSTILAAVLAFAAAVPASAGTYLSNNGLRVVFSETSGQIEVFPGLRERNVLNLYCAAAETARNQLGARTVDRIQIQAMPRGGQGGQFVLRKRGSDPYQQSGLTILSKRGSSQTVAAALASCRY